MHTGSTRQRSHLRTADPYEIALPLAWPQRLAAVALLVGLLCVYALVFAVAVLPAELRGPAGWTCAAVLLGVALLNTFVMLTPPSLRISVSEHGVRLGRTRLGVEELLGCGAVQDRLELRLSGRRTWRTPRLEAPARELVEVAERIDAIVLPLDERKDAARGRVEMERALAVARGRAGARTA